MRKVLVFMAVLLFQNSYSTAITLKTKYASISVNEKGFITSIKDLKGGNEYFAKGQNTPLLDYNANQSLGEPSTC